MIFYGWPDQAHFFSSLNMLYSGSDAVMAVMTNRAGGENMRKMKKERILGRLHRQPCQRPHSYVSIGLAIGIIGAPYVTPVEMGLMSLFVLCFKGAVAMLALIAVRARYRAPLLYDRS